MPASSGNCTCPALDPSDSLHYRLMDSGGLHNCEPTYLPGSPECMADTRGNASCSHQRCQTHCCHAGVPNDCTLCDGVGGACYRPLTLAPGWEAAAKLEVSTGWVGRINQGELQTLKGPPPAFAGSMLRNAKNGSGLGGSSIRYSLLWSANASAAVVGQHPPPQTLRGAGEQLDPGFITLDSDTGDVSSKVVATPHPLFTCCASNSQRSRAKGRKQLLPKT